MLFASALTLAVVGYGPVGTSKDLEARWRNEYPAAAKTWSAVMANFVAEGRFSYHANDRSITTIDALTVAALSGQRLYIRDQVKEREANRETTKVEPGVSCRTPEVKFGLRKLEPSDRYLLVYHDKNDEDRESTFSYWYQKYVTNATNYYGRSFLERMLDPTFSLTAIEAAQRDGAELVRIHYTYENKYVFETGHVDLEPGKNWGIRSVDMTTKNKGKWGPSIYKQEVTYREVAPGRYFPCHMESNEPNPTEPEIFERAIVDFDKVELGAAIPEMFRLSAYGLPDLPLRPQPRMSIFTLRNPVLWFALASTVVCLVGLWLLRSRRVGQA